jgi:hypothetical protein
MIRVAMMSPSCHKPALRMFLEDLALIPAASKPPPRGTFPGTTGGGTMCFSQFGSCRCFGSGARDTFLTRLPFGIGQPTSSLTVNHNTAMATSADP